MTRAIISRLPVAARGATLLLNAILAVVVGRIFGATASGEFFLAFAAVNLAGMVGRLGSESLAIKILPSLYHNDKVDDFWTELKWLRRVCRIGSAAVAVFIFVIGLAFFAMVPGDFGIHLAVLAVSIPFTCAAILESSALRSANKISMGAFAETGLSQGLTIVSLLIVTSVFHSPPIVISVCYAIAAVATALLSRWWTRSSVPHAARSIMLVSKTRQEFLSMLQMMGSNVLFFFLTSSPLFALGVAGSAREVGLYNAAARSSTVISLIPALQTTYLIPRVARDLASADLASVNAQLRRAVRLAGAFATVLAIAMLVFAEEITRIFGGDFIDAQSTLVVLVVGQTLILLLGNVNPIMSIAGLERTSLRIGIGTVLVGLPLMLLVAGPWGAVGVAAVFIAATFAYSITCAILLRSRLGVRCFIN